MKLLGNRILVRITKENRESIYSKEIIRNDGTKTKLFINVAAQDDKDARGSSLFVQTGIVEMVSDEVKDVQVGDIALLDYQLCNSVINFFSKDEKGELYWLNATTTYYDHTEVAYQTRRSRRDQIVFSKGEIDELSMLLGVIRNDELIARAPYVFLLHLPVMRILTTDSGIVFQEKDKIVTREVLAISDDSTKKYGIEKGDNVLAADADIFMVEYDGKKIDCIHDSDVMANADELKKAVKRFTELKAV